MNQILDYNPNKNSGGKPSGSDTIVRVFAVLIACFAICLVAGGIYGVHKNKTTVAEAPAAPTEAVISVEQGETTAKILVSHDKAIEKLIYSWDSGKENNVKGTGEASMEAEVPLLAGTHTLTVKVTDIDGVEATYQEEITSETGEDKIYPVIDMGVTDQKKLKITATDETSIDFVTYRWNDDEEVKVEVSDNDDKVIEFEIDILKGKNDLLIVAVDKNNNSTTETKTFTGVTKPDITITIGADKKTGDVKVFHENGIKAITLKINDMDYNVEISEESPTEVSFPLPELAIGTNKILVTATSVDDTVTEVTEEVSSEASAEDIVITIEPKEGSADLAVVTAKTADGIKQLFLNINGQDYDVTLGEENLKETSFDIPLVEGSNTVTVKVVTVNDFEKEEVKDITR
ncbi:MAG: hypothetical protein IJW20_06490 [Clostridia bacterium]|nr:hypothetical protein [Clostridia bacterium]